MNSEHQPRPMTAREFEDAVGDVLWRHFPYGLLSRVPIFNPENKEEHLFANELDHLVHFNRDGTDHLVILECKNQPITNSEDPRSPAPTGNERWFFHYKRPIGRDQFEHTSSDVRRQLRRQTEALVNLLELKAAQAITIECWVVHTRSECPPLSFNQTGGHHFRAVSLEQLDSFLPGILNGADVMPLNRSVFLARLQKAVPRAGAPHPPILDALDYIAAARKSVDRLLFVRFNGWFHSKPNLWAVKGSAGSGKSMLLAYTLAVLATNHRIAWVKDAGEHHASECTDFMPEGVPPFDQRRIQASAMNTFQLEALRRHFGMFVDTIASYHPQGRPATLPVTFTQWNNVISPECNVLILDEAHDLDENGQVLIAQWHQNDPGNRYLVIGIDRQQHIRTHLSGHKSMIPGLNFRGRHNMMSRNYRSPFTAYMTSLALLFRWYSSKGPMVKPMLIAPDVGKFAKFKTFKGGIGVKVEEGDGSNHCRIWIRNDSHPANYWVRTVDLFSSARNLHEMLQLERVGKNQVLWLRFDGQSSDLEDRVLAQATEYYRVSPLKPEAFIDENIKGLEFPIVVIEGLPIHFDMWTDQPRMWQARRLLYICASRATAFLYFVLPKGGQTTQPRLELVRILDQLQKPIRLSQNDTGETWCMELDWRPNDIIELGDYDDGFEDEEKPELSDS